MNFEQIYIICAIIVGLIMFAITLFATGLDGLLKGDFSEFLTGAPLSIVIGVSCGTVWPLTLAAAVCYAMLYVVFFPLSKFVQFYYKKRSQK